MLLALETPRIAGECPSARAGCTLAGRVVQAARPAVNPLPARASPHRLDGQDRDAPWNGRQRARVLSHGSAWIWAFPTALPMASAQAAEMNSFFEAPLAIG